MKTVDFVETIAASDLKVSRIRHLIISPAYKVYRGYIVFAFSVYMFVCVCVLVCLLTFFLSKISRKLLDLGF